MISKYKRLVIKIGSTSIIEDKTKIIKSNWLESLCGDIANLYQTKKIIVVCSGAIALGTQIIRNKKTFRRLEDKQAAAAVGQIELAQQCITE